MLTSRSPLCKNLVRCNANLNELLCFVEVIRHRELMLPTRMIAVYFLLISWCVFLHRFLLLFLGFPRLFLMLFSSTNDALIFCVLCCVFYFFWHVSGFRLGTEAKNVMIFVLPWEMRG